MSVTEIRFILISSFAILASLTENTNCMYPIVMHLTDKLKALIEL